MPSKSLSSLFCAGLLMLPLGRAAAEPAVPPAPAATAPAPVPQTAPIKKPAPPPSPSLPGLNLEDAIRLTLRSSNDAIRIEDEKVNSAAAKLKQASGAFDWTASGEGGYETLYVPRVQNGLLPAEGVLTNQTDTLGTGYISGGIGREFRNGISIRPGVTAYPSSQASVAQTLGQTQFRPSLGLQIPLLRGLGETAADALERSAQENLRGTSFARDFAITSLVHDAVQIYWRCLASDEIARTTTEADRRATEYEDSLHQMAGRGMIEPTVAERASAIAVSRRLSVEQADDAAETCHRDLAAATADSPRGGVMAAGDSPRMEGLGPVLDRLNEDALESLALENRADAKAARQSVAAAEAKLDGAKNGVSPALSLNIEPDRAIVRYSQSLGNNTAEGQLAEASADTSQARIALDRLELQIRRQVSDSLRALRRAYSDWAMLDEAARKMGVVVINANGRAKLGVVDRSDYVSAETQLANIKNQLTSARLQYASSLAALRLATGTVDPVLEKPDTVAAKFSSPDFHS